MRKQHLSIAAALILVASLRLSSAQSTSADLVLINGKIWTGEPYLAPGQKARPSKVVEAVAIRDGRFLVVGTDADVRSAIGPATRVIDLQGRMAMPGINDAHVHFVLGSAQLTQVYLKDTKSQQEFTQRIADFAKTKRPGEWILGGNWDETNWPGGKLPTSVLIDAVTPNNPVYVKRYDGHEALMNTLAMKLAGISKSTKEPVGGKIERLSNGEPAGVIKDSVRDIVEPQISPFSPEEFEQVVRAGLRELSKDGVTSVGDMNYGQRAPSGSPADLVELLQRAERDGWLTARFNSIIPVDKITLLTDLGASRHFGDDWVRVGGLKAYADGSIGSRTGWFFDDYTDEPGFRGIPRVSMNPRSNMETAVKTAMAHHLQLNVHAVGDRANAEMLDVIQQFAGAQAPQYRFRIEHAQHVRPQDFARFAKLGVIASMQPYHASDDGRFVDDRIGRQRSKSSYAWRSMLDADAPLAFGSDWPIAPIDPMTGIWAAVSRATTDGKTPGGWIPEQKITMEETLRAYTQGSAYAEFEEGNKGTITAGKLADIIVLSQDLFAIPTDQILQTKVFTTIVNGKVVYQAEEKQK